MTTPKREVHAVIARVLALPDTAKFEVFDALREDLGEQIGEDDPTVQLVLERKEAIGVIGLVSEYLGLAADEAPTGRQFDEVVGQVAEDWDSRRVIRLWERWSLAIQAYKGEREVKPRVRREVRRDLARGKGKRSKSDLINGVRRWLETKPEKETAAAYSLFAEQHNAGLAETNSDEKRLVSARSICQNLALSWPVVLEVAKKKVELPEAQEAYFAERLPPPSEHRIIGLAAVSRLLKRSPSQINYLIATSKHFPVPVAYIQGHRAWLYEDVKIFKRGLAPPVRDEGELQYLFADAEELKARLLIDPPAFQKALRRARWDKIPKPEGALVQSVYYWKRSSLNHWLKGIAKTWAIAESLKAGLGNAP